MPITIVYINNTIEKQRMAISQIFSKIFSPFQGCIRCFCGPTCAICWIVIGVWAFFFCGILAILFATGKQGNIGHYKQDDPMENAKTLGWVVLIYVILTAFCSWNLWYRSKHPSNPASQETPAQQYEQINE